jgi:TRAP-type C4-dicarboxylate transport system permease small subunit
MTALAVVVVAGVFYRYALNNALSWTDEVGGILLVWITYLGAVVALDRGAHMDMDLFAGRIHGRARTALRALVDIALGILLIVVMVNGWSIATRLMGQTMVSLPIPRGAVQSVMPISAALMLVVLTVRWAMPEVTTAVRQHDAARLEGTE